MKPLTTAEARAWIASLPAELQPGAQAVAFSVYDEGMTAGLANLPRSSNPFLVPPAPEKSKGKR